MLSGLHWSAWLLMFGFAGIAEQVDKLSPGLVAGMFLSVLAFGVFAELGGLTYDSQGR